MKTVFKLRTSWLVAIASIVFLANCGGGDDPVTQTAVTVDGIFVDSPVSGLTYTSNSASGVTNTDGVFSYVEGDIVNFTYGAVRLGGARGKGVITPMDIMTSDTDRDSVRQMASLLQSLDTDGAHGNGISLNSLVAAILTTKLADPALDFTPILNDSGLLDFTKLKALEDAAATDTDAATTFAAVTLDLETLLRDVIDEAVATDANLADMRYVDPDQAANNLLAAVEGSWIFRKNISKTPELASAKAKLDVMPVWVPARRSDDVYWADDATLTVLDNSTSDGDEFCQVTWPEGSTSQVIVGRWRDNQCWIKPLVTTYIDTDERYVAGAGQDTFVAISRDDGLTWKRANISRTGDRDVTSSTAGFPLGFKGTARKPVMQVKNNYIMVAWTDSYCNGGQPTYSLTQTVIDPVTSEEVEVNIYDDFYGVAGAQGFVDYTEQLDPTDPRMPVPSIQPYSCLWSARGVINAATGDISLYMPERVTSGRRDAYQVAVAAAPGGGFAISWQEDPEGLQAGSAKGPGDGMSGATASHKTDVWYNYIPWGQFAQVDADFVPGADDPDPIADDPDGGLGRVKALNPLKVPVRITDNDVCNADNMFSYGHKWCALARDSEGQLYYPDADAMTALQAAVDAAATAEPMPAVTDLTTLGLDMVNCEYLVDYSPVDPTLSGKTGLICVTEAGTVLDGDTAATRPNVFLQKDVEGKTWALIGYEETKGRNDVFFEVGGEFIQAVEDDGKISRYHSFAYDQPDLIAAGGPINMPEVDESGLPIVRWCQNNLGGMVYHDLGVCPEGYKPVYAYENSRRVRFVMQGEKAVKKSKTVLIALWKEGKEGQGAASDILSRRMVVGAAAAAGANPYAYENFVCDAWDVYGTTCLAGTMNLSSPDPLLVVDEPPTQIDPIGDSLTVCPKVTAWGYTADALHAATDAVHCDDARAHRGQIRGDFVVMGYTWTPNWAAARNGNDAYNFYVRRSFDGGVTWTTMPAAQGGTGVQHCQVIDPTPSDVEDPTTVSADKYIDCSDTSLFYAAGAFEPPRNVSLLKNNKESVIEPRIVAVPGAIALFGDANFDGKPDTCTWGIDKDGDGVIDFCFDEDNPNSNIFVASYGLANNTDENDDGELESYPTDLFFAKSNNKGESYLTVAKTVTKTDADGIEVTLTEEVWPWLAMRKDVEEGEAQWRLTPAGDRLYAVWLSESGSSVDLSSHFYGSDIWFRKLDDDDFSWGAPSPDDETTGGVVDTDPGDDEL